MSRSIRLAAATLVALATLIAGAAVGAGASSATFAGPGDGWCC